MRKREMLIFIKKSKFRAGYYYDIIIKRVRRFRIMNYVIITRVKWTWSIRFKTNGFIRYFHACSFGESIFRQMSNKQVL